jgi:hypothetical protein
VLHTFRRWPQSASGCQLFGRPRSASPQPLSEDPAGQAARRDRLTPALLAVQQYGKDPRKWKVDKDFAEDDRKIEHEQRDAAWRAYDMYRIIMDRISITEPFSFPGGNLAEVCGYMEYLKYVDEGPFNYPKTIDCSNKVQPSWTVIDLGMEDPKNAPIFDVAQNASSYAYTERLLEKLLPHIRLDGEEVTVEQCHGMGLCYNAGHCAGGGSYAFPNVHRDHQWATFQSAPGGFQAWILCENSGTTGNMMMVEHAESLDDTNLACTLVEQEDGRVAKLDLTSTQLVKTYDTWKDAKVKMCYPALKPGQAILFHKNHMHTSDPRPPEHLRVALAVRFLVGKKGQSEFRAWSGNKCMEHLMKRELRNGRATPLPMPGWVKVRPTLTSMMNADMIDDLGVWSDKQKNPGYDKIAVGDPFKCLSLCINSSPKLIFRIKVAPTVCTVSIVTVALMKRAYVTAGITAAIGMGALALYRKVFGGILRIDRPDAEKKKTN